MDKFWMVKAVPGGPANCTHYSEESAKREAERLARQCPGTRFFVLEAMESCRVIDVEWSQAYSPDEFKDLPF